MSEARLFANVSLDLQARLVKAGKFRTFAPGTVLWRRGEHIKNVYLLLSGRVGLFDSLAQDRTSIIALFEPGHMIAGAPALLKVPNAFWGQVIDEARMLVIPIATFRDYVASDPELVLATAMSMAAHRRESMVQLRDAKRCSVNQRLGFYLLSRTAKKHGDDTIELSDDPLLIAGMLGVSRESLSRRFAELHKYGVTKRGRRVTLDIARLRHFCERPN